MLEKGGAGGGGEINWFLPKRGIVAGVITEVEYIALPAVRNIMLGIVWDMTIHFRKGG